MHVAPTSSNVADNGILRKPDAPLLSHYFSTRVPSLLSWVYSRAAATRRDGGSAIEIQRTYEHPRARSLLKLGSPYPTTGSPFRYTRRTHAIIRISLLTRVGGSPNLDYVDFASARKLRRDIIAKKYLELAYVKYRVTPGYSAIAVITEYAVP